MLVSDKRANNFLKELLQAIPKFTKKITAIILFGSHARNEATIFSDIDILIVLKTRDKKLLSRLTGYMRFLELQFNYSSEPSTKLDLFLQYLNIATGMFRSWFICSQNDLLTGNFSKITGTNKIIGKIFVPAKLILDNIKKEGKVIYGNFDFQTLIPEVKIKNQQCLRSFILNEILAICALCITPFSKLSFLYSLEAIKWSLFQVKSPKKFHSNSNKRLMSALKLYYHIKVSGIPNPYLGIYSPYLVLKLHLIAIHQLKKIKSNK